jgi:hypothetical protein
LISETSLRAALEPYMSIFHAAWASSAGPPASRRRLRDPVLHRLACRAAAAAHRAVEERSHIMLKARRPPLSHRDDGGSDPAKAVLGDQEAFALLPEQRASGPSLTFS